MNHFDEFGATTLAIPNGAGTLTPTPTADILRPPGVPATLQLPPRPGSEAPSAESGFFGSLTDKQRLTLALGIAGLGDIAQGVLSGGKQQGSALKTVLGIRQSNAQAAREERAARTEERRADLDERKFTLDQLRFIRTEQREQMQEWRVFATQASDLSGKIIGIPEGEQRTAAINAMVDEARTRGGDRLATVVTGILTADPNVGPKFGPLLRHVPEVLAPALMQEGALLFHNGKSEDALKKAQVLALPDIAETLFQRIDSIGADLRDQFKGKQIPLATLEAAIKAANPRDPSGSNPELGLLHGVGDVYSKAADVVKDRLAARGFEIPGEARKASEAAAATAATTAAAEGVKLSPEVTEARAKAEAKVKEAVLKVERSFDLSKPLTASEQGTVRQQFLTQAKDFSDTVRSYQRVEDSVKNPSAAGDLALIFNYMKMLDPGSAVREGEQATAANARGVPDAVASVYNRLLTGERLAEAQRADFLARARILVKGQLDLHENTTEKTFRDIAKKGGADPATVVPDIIGDELRKKIKETPEPKPIAATAPPKDATVEHGRVELKRLMDGGLTRADALERMKSKGWK